MNRLFALPLLLCLASAAPAQKADCPEGAAVADWRTVATESDRVRLKDWRTAFTDALKQARTSNAADVETEGLLLQPDAAIGGPIPNGDYSCRVIKVGAKSEGMLNYVSYPAFRCRISQQGDVQHFDKLNGSQRPHGTIYAGDQLRQVFLGTMLLGDETVAYQYGRDTERDMAGWVERIGEQRWRLVLPYPHYESTLDVVELTPAT
jgi:uncharacterized protein DUF4893